jgi:hypothetical protein
MSNPVLDIWTPNWYSTASDEEQTNFREWFRGVLRSERVNVCFTKADGSERWLHCTLHPDLIPVVESAETPQRKTSEAAQSVWDLDKRAWRSFRWDSIQQFSFSLGDLHE